MYKLLKMKNFFALLMICLFSIACSQDDQVDQEVDDDSISQQTYFPPVDGSEWQESSFEDLNWNESELDQLFTYLQDNNTRAFIVLKNGKIAIEKYWGNNIVETSEFDENTKWYWASAGKTLTATLIGIAQQEGNLDINDKTSDYLGEGWTSMEQEKENLIKIKNQLTMTTGLDYEVPDLNCTQASCLQYKTDAGNQWFYHNAPYTLLKQVVENATDTDYNDYSDEKLEQLIGMNGEWTAFNDINLYWSTARDMARFGLLIANDGQWEETSVLSDQDYLDQMINTSQNLNPSYGYLWWLNGKSSIIFPGVSDALNTELATNAPNDLIAGLGKNGQFVEIIPSKDLVVIRLGESPDGSLVPIVFHNEMWEKLNLVIK